MRRSDDSTPDPAIDRGVPVRVVLADDHGLMRRSLRGLLDAESGVEVLAEAGDLAGIAREVRAHRPRVLLIDLGMSNGSSLDTIRLLRIEAPATEIVVLAMEASWAYARAALDAGAIGFVLKQAADTDLFQAVLSAARGERYVSPRLAAGLDSPDGQGSPDGLESPGGTESPDRVELPDGAELPDRAELPDGAESPDRAEAPDGPESPAGRGSPAPAGG